LEWKYSDQNFGMKIFRPKNWPENIQTKILCRNIQTKILA
jgi:hypothetical protein